MALEAELLDEELDAAEFDEVPALKLHALLVLGADHLEHMFQVGLGDGDDLRDFGLGEGGVERVGVHALEVVDPVDVYFVDGLERESALVFVLGVVFVGDAFLEFVVFHVQPHLLAHRE